MSVFERCEVVDCPRDPDTRPVSDADIWMDACETHAADRTAKFDGLQYYDP